MFLELDDGEPLRAQIANTPVQSDHRLQTWAVFAQDRWVIDRATINFGVRLDGVQAFLPAQSSPAGTFVGERSLPEDGRLRLQPATSRRASASRTTSLATAGRL